MATLTWRDVAAPDFRTSLAAFESFRNGIGDAVAGTQQAISKFDADRSDQVNRAFALELAKYSDPDKLNAALTADPTFGLDARRINPANLAIARNMVTTLLNQKDLAGDVAFEGYTRDRTKADNSASDAAKPLISQIITAGLARDEAGAAKLMSDPRFAALNPDAQFSIATKGLDLVKGGLDITGERQDQNIKGTEFTWKTKDRAAADEADKLYAQVLDSTRGGDNNDVIGALTTLGKGFSPKARALVDERLRGAGYSPFGSSAGGGVDLSGGTAGGDPSRVITSGGAGNLGIGSLPDSVKTMGQVSSFASQLNQRGQESSASGLYQIVGSTLRSYAPKVFGKNWQSMDYSAGNQDKIAQAIFNDNRGSAAALRKQWVSLTPNEAEQIRKMPWEQARQVIARKESGGNPAEILRRAAQISPTISQKEFSEANRNPLALRIPEALQKSETPFEAADALRGSSFKGVPREFLEGRIRDIMNKTGASASVAAAILSKNRESVKPNSIWDVKGAIEDTIGRATGQKSPNLGDGTFRIDDYGVERDIAAYTAPAFDKNGRPQRSLLGDVDRNNVRANIAADVQTARAAVEQTRARLVQRQLAKGTNPNLDISRDIQMFNAAQAALAAALRRQTGQ